MQGFQLPDPVKTATHPRDRESLESITTGRPIQWHETIPPEILPAIEQRPLQNLEMERTLSLNSGYTSGQSSYAPSRSASPSATHSPGTSGGFSHEIDLHQPSDSNNASKHTQHSQRSPGEPSRKKRRDRRECLQLSTNHGTSKRLSKDKTEAGRRLKHTNYIGQIQRQLETINSSLPAEAHGGPWKPLKKNNMSGDCTEPLLYNKENIYASQIQVTQDTQQILEDVLEERKNLATDAAALLCLNLPPAAAAFLGQIAQQQWVQQIAESARHRGANRFRRPLQSNRRSLPRL